MVAIGTSVLRPVTFQLVFVSPLWAYIPSFQAKELAVKKFWSESEVRGLFDL